jgi:membrane protein DedA with SNARE-associated domain
MSETIEFLVRNGPALLFGWLLAEQIGLPIPAIPLLLAAGALSGSGRMGLPAALAAAIAGGLLGDSVWFLLGRKRGSKVLSLLCRMSLEPDSCVRRTELVFGRYGIRSLVFAKFVPGLSTAAPPLAGVFGMGWARFLLYDGAGTLLYTGVFMGLGAAFSIRLEAIAEPALRLGEWLGAALLGVLAAYVLWKYAQRRRFLGTLRVARIEAAELKSRIDAGEEILVVDLRHPLDFEAEPHLIPGALRLSPEEIETRHAEIPRDRDVVLYCT